MVPITIRYAPESTARNHSAADSAYLGYNLTDAHLHQANCGTITGEPARGDVFVGDYVKICALGRAELDHWAIRNVGTSIPPCKQCF